jgi:hypothetical protein
MQAHLFVKGMSMKTMLAVLAALAISPAFAQYQPADAARVAEVAQRGAQVMPFDLAATTHVFSKTADGGLQRVVAKDRADARQVSLVRSHLRDLEQQFGKGDFSGPGHIHGSAMPGLARLKAARPGQVAISYKTVDGGAELAYRSKDPAMVAALHEWFDAQLADHGKDATDGHPHKH